jgi:hypothetical protein
VAKYFALAAKTLINDGSKPLLVLKGLSWTAANG